MRKKEKIVRLKNNKARNNGVKHLKKNILAVLGVLLLGILSILYPLSTIRAESENANQNKEIGNKNEVVSQKLLEEFGFENQQRTNETFPTEAVQEFSFETKTFKTTVGQPVVLKFTSRQEADQVLVRIPANGQIAEEAFSNGESIQHSHGEYWTLKTSRQQTEFVLPVVFEKAGQYFLTIDHDADHFYLEVEGIYAEVQEDSALSEEAEANLEDQQQKTQDNTGSELPIVIQPVMVTENNLSISEALISAEEARILEEISDVQGMRTTTSVSNWSQFRSAWNSSKLYESIRVTTIINFSSSILGSSLNKINDAGRDIHSINGGVVNVGTSGNSLHLENGVFSMSNVRIESENSGNQPLIEIDRSAWLNIGAGVKIINRRNSPAVTSNDSRVNFDSSYERRIIYNEAAVSPIQLTRNSILDFFVGGVVIGSNNTSNSWVPPISSDANSTILFSHVSANVMMGGRINVQSNNAQVVTHLTSYSVPWNSVTAEITGVNGSIVNSSNSDPNDFSERYLANHNSNEYRSITVGASASEGFVPPISAFDLSLTASPQEAGNPKADSTTIAANTTTSIHANPNEGYRFVSWEIISGTGAKIGDETAESTIFTMGTSDAVVSAVYEEVPVIRDAVLTVEFVNELDQLLPGYTVTIEDYLIGDGVDLTKNQAVINQLTALESAGYEIAERPANETAILLDEAEVTVRYKIQGVLSLASAPNSLDFGTLVYDATTQRVEDPDIDQPLIVTDTRAEAENGWRLTATLSTPMKTDDGKELVNALRYVYQGQETILDTNAQTVYLNTAGSAGSFNVSNSWGNQTGTDGVKLQISSSDIVHTGSYTGVITWKVMAGQP